MKKTTLPYGLWPSPLSPRSLAADKRLSEVQWDSDGRTLVWLEGRGDRGVLVALAEGDDAPRDLTSDLSVRAEVGYGGGDFTVHGGYAYFLVSKTGRIYRQPLAGGTARPITPAFGQAAAPSCSPDGRLVLYVHHDTEQIDRLAVVDAEGSQWPQILHSGHDFYMQPCWSPDGRRVAWVAWDHPNMPWDGTLLYVGEMSDESGRLPRLQNVRVVAGGPDVAIFQPQFTRDGNELLYISDESGFGRLAALNLASGQLRWLTPEGAEHIRPAWTQGMRSFAPLSDGRHVALVRSELGFENVYLLDLHTGGSERVAALADYSDVSQITASPQSQQIAFLGSSPTVPPRVVIHDFQTGRTRIAARASGETIPRESLAACQAIRWTSKGGEVAHGLYYAPHGVGYESSGKPPLIVLVHGGPTSQAKAGWTPMVQFFTTRGYAVLQVNYRGSTGYGRAYMLRLRGNWGLCDVEDCISGMRHLADSGEIDPSKAVIMGGSAGGFTVLQTMTTQPEAFAAGISMYGVANQFDLAADTHKFEARYLDSMLGPLPDAAAIYRERSPIFHAQRICRPLAVFQGDVDKVVPRDQSDTIVEALRRNGVPHVYHVYEGEGHGWRKTETLIHFYGAVESFLKKYVLFA